MSRQIHLSLTVELDEAVGQVPLDEVVSSLQSLVSKGLSGTSLVKNHTVGKCPRVLVVVSEGVAGAVSDHCVDAEIFDWDDHKSSPSEGVPAHFSDLALPLGIPVDWSTATDINDHYLMGSSYQVSWKDVFRVLKVANSEISVDAAISKALFNRLNLDAIEEELIMGGSIKEQILRVDDEIFKQLNQLGVFHSETTQPMRERPGW